MIAWVRNLTWWNTVIAQVTFVAHYVLVQNFILGAREVDIGIHYALVQCFKMATITCATYMIRNDCLDPRFITST